jgi:hypothetical protein
MKTHRLSLLLPVLLLLGLFPPSARADVSDGGGLLLLGGFILVPLLLIYVFFRAIRAFIPAQYREVVFSLAVGVPINFTLFKALRVLEPPVTSGKVTFAVLSIGALVIAIARHIARQRRD